MYFAREHREPFKPIDLGPFDLGIPVRALHEPYHKPVATSAPEIDHPVQHERRALLIRLHDEANPVPAGKQRVEAEGFQQVEREFEAIRLFGVNVQAHVVGSGQCSQSLYPRKQLRHHTVTLQARIAGMQC